MRTPTALCHLCVMDVHGASLPSNAAGLTPPPYTATLVDHDYTKRNTLRRRQQTKRNTLRRRQQTKHNTLRRRQQTKRNTLRRQQTKRNTLRRRQQTKRNTLRRRQQTKRNTLRRRQQTKRNTLRRRQQTKHNTLRRRQQTKRNTLRRQQTKRNTLRRQQTKRNTLRRQQTKRNTLRRQQTKRNTLRRQQTKRNTLRRRQQTKRNTLRRRQQTKRNTLRRRQQTKRNTLRRRQQTKHNTLRRQQTKRNTLRRQQTKRNTFRRQQTKRNTFRRQQTKRNTFRRQQTKRNTFRRQQTKRNTFRRQQTKRNTLRRQQTKRNTFRRQQTKRNTLRRQQTKRNTFRRQQTRKQYEEELMNLRWPRDVLLGSSVPWQQLKYMPARGLFYEGNKTNLFIGIWHIPVDEIDRPGSFASHMNRSIVLLLEVLSQLKDHDTLIKFSFMLQRTPDQGKKYLRDVDRQVLAQRAFFLAVKFLEDNLNKLTGVSEQPSKVPAPSMGEMTTADTSNRPSAEDSSHALHKKPELTEEPQVTAPGPDSGSRETPQTQPALLATDRNRGDQQQRTPSGKVEAAVGEWARAGPEEPMELDAGHWGRPSKTTDSQGRQPDTESPRTVLVPGEKVVESSRAPELSLEDLSISSRQQQQQQLQCPVAKGPVLASGAEQGLAQGALCRPSRKRKLLDDVESGETLLLDAYRVWQQGQNVMTYDLGRIEKIMSETYMLIKQVDEDVALDQAVKFCQIQMATSAQRQSAGDAPTTPKYTKDNRDIFFPASLPTPVLLSHTACHPLSIQIQDSQAKLQYEPLGKVPRPPASGSHEQPQHRRAPLPIHPASTMAFNPQTDELEEPAEGLSYRQQESHLCQQMKLATVSPGQEAAGWPHDEPASCSTTQTCLDQQLYGSSEQSKMLDPSRVRSRIPPNMPKLFIPSTVTKFPPEITVTPPTPTLLSPKGSISEETKQRLKNVILSSQSAATVKETLSQPALEVQETSSQESSLESESDDEDEEDDYMDI
ncbi:calcineurin-binding protein cabin-1-like isoform X4 [Oncorhynchus mykiss]|uniref:calcineurin-binding protein cabin-1-like isoform X4 n=1 Tax=Oncorhynchus mykiss TaxID=8022 RepID=UPI0018777669|nr:calcineurin-binding protein cabin-1-like isoform X4 [Oncorhynchus mykiss]